MTSTLSLEAKLNCMILAVMLLISAVGLAWAVRDARTSVRQESSASVELALGLIDAALMAEEFRPTSVNAWIQRVGHIEKIRHLRIGILPGAVPIESGLPKRDAPPFDAVPAWFRWWVNVEPVVVLREMAQPDGQFLTLRIESYAEDEIREAWEEVQGFLVLQCALLVAIYLSVHFIAGRALRPVTSILKGLSAIEEGDYDASLPRFGLSELDRISSGINHLSSSLKASRDENRALTRHSLTIQEDERRSIAQEIHDEFGQNLTAIKMMTGMIQGETQVTSEIQRLCDRSFAAVRALMRRLRPMVLEDLGLKAAIADLKDHWQKSFPDFDLNIQCDPALEELKGVMSLEIYRIIQEAVTNALRHSEGTRALVLIEALPMDMISLVIKDDGKGILEWPERRGFGLIGMRERVASLRGKFQLVNRPDEGLEIRVLMPLNGVDNE